MFKIFILTLCLWLLPLQSAKSSSIDGVSVITPVSYAVDSKWGDTLKSKSLLALANMAGKDVKKEVLEKLKPYESSLLKYFPSQKEYNTFINATLDQGISTHLQKINDPNMKAFSKYLGNTLMANIAARILDKEGIKNSSRKSAWIAKLLTPFNQCINSAKNAYYEGLHCVDALSSSLVPTIGSAIVFEKTNDNISSNLDPSKRQAFNLERVKQYQNCVGSSSSPEKVHQCALDSIRTGVIKVSDQELDKVLKSNIPNLIEQSHIKQKAMASFNKCSNSVGKTSSDVPLEKQFKNCIDQLLKEAGGLIVQNTIANNKSVIETMGAKEANQLASKESAKFESCVAELIKKRDAKGQSGLVDTSSCQNNAKSHVTLNVISNTLKDSAEEFIPNKSMAKQVSDKSLDQLNKCWNPQADKNSQEACLKTTIIGFSKNIASIKLDSAIPSDIKEKNTIKNDSLVSLGSCLSNNLPKDITGSKDISSDISKCTEPLTINVAKAVATIQVKNSAKDKLTNAEIDSLIKSKVDKDFVSCLGKNPSDSQLNKCIDTLTKESAKVISRKSFDKEIDDFIKSNGGLTILSLSQNDVNKFRDSLNMSNESCIESQSKEKEIINHVNKCLKESIKKIALFLGEAKFNSSVASMYKDRPNEQKALASEFKSSFGKCLSSKDEANFSLDDYTKNISICSNQIEKSTTLKVAQDQVDSSLNNYLKDSGKLDNSQLRTNLRDQLLNDFKTCTAKSADTNSCVDNLKKSATKEIVINYGRIETKMQLNTEKMPEKISMVEGQFKECLNKTSSNAKLSEELDECIKYYALSLAQELGTLKFNNVITGAVGSDGFKQHESEINSILSGYVQCLDKLKPLKLSDDILNKITICTKSLETNGISFVSKTLSKWMSSENKSLANQDIKDSFAELIPCLTFLLPSSPVSSDLQENTDSILKPVAKLLGQYIDYNPENAKETLEGVLETIKVDLNNENETQQAKVDLLDLIYKNGSLDQFFKSFVRGEVLNAFKGVSHDEISEELKNSLTRKENFEQIFNSADGVKIKDTIFKDIIKPVLLNNKSISSPDMSAKIESIKNDVIKTLINAPTFGQELVRSNIQGQINQISGLKKFFAKTFYGKSSLDWDKLRNTPHGKAAEEFINEKILVPKFKGVEISPQEMAKITKQAEAMVTEAVKNSKSGK